MWRDPSSSLTSFLLRVTHHSGSGSQSALRSTESIPGQGIYGLRILLFASKQQNECSVKQLHLLWSSRLSRRTHLKSSHAWLSIMHQHDKAKFKNQKNSINKKQLMPLFYCVFVHSVVVKTWKKCKKFMILLFLFLFTAFLTKLNESAYIYIYIWTWNLQTKNYS